MAADLQFLELTWPKGQRVHEVSYCGPDHARSVMPVS